MNVREVATKAVIVVAFLLVVYIAWFVLPSEIPDWIYWGGAIFLLLFVILKSEKMQKK